MTGLANPSATIGLSAVNGVALTAMSSDSAPKLSQAIIPTWTGLHTFSAGLTVSGGTTTISGHTLVLSANATIGGTNTGDQVVPVSANPSASVGLSVVNGSAATFMTSDSAPALSQAIVPTWTSTRTFSKNVVINSTTTALAVNGAASEFSGFFTASSAAGNSLGVLIRGGTTAGDVSVLAQNQAGTVSLFSISGDGHGISRPFYIFWQRLSWNTAGAMTFSAAIGVNGASPPAKVTGWGTPTGQTVVNNFAAGAGTPEATDVGSNCADYYKISESLQESPELQQRRR